MNYAAVTTLSTGADPFWNSVGSWVTGAANILTIVAGFIAIISLISAWLSRPKIAFRNQQMLSTTWSVLLYISSEGASPVRHVSIYSGAMDSNQVNIAGGGGPGFGELERFRTFTVHLFTAEQVFFEAPERDDEVRLSFPSGVGCWLAIEYDRSIIRWKRMTTVFIWSNEARVMGDPPERAEGRRAKKFLLARFDESNSVSRPGYVKPEVFSASDLPDEVFYDRLGENEGINVVFVTGQSDKAQPEPHREIIDTFASRHRDHANVYVVDLYDSRVAREVLKVTQIPSVLVFRGTELLDASVGVPHYRELEERILRSIDLAVG